MKKGFFKTRTAEEIRDLNLIPVSRARGLTYLIEALDPSRDALVIRFPLIPGRFLINVQNFTEASRKFYKHGDVILLDQPTTKTDAYYNDEIPITIRERTFLDKLCREKEEDIDYIGFSFTPVQGRDKRKRRVPFVWDIEGQKLFAYSEHMTRGIDVKPYQDSQRVKLEGAEIVCSVPSRTVKKQRYKIKLQNVPVKGNTERRAVVWSLKSSFEIDPEHSMWNIRYTWEHDRESKETFTFYPHDIAAYIKIVGSYWREHNNLTPMEMNPFVLFSKRGVEIYKKWDNNVLVFDPTLNSKSKLRKPHISEKSLGLARAIGVLGHDEIAYWDPHRDGKLKDYDWSIPGKTV